MTISFDDFLKVDIRVGTIVERQRPDGWYGLGKIDVQGPDAAAFLDRVYTNTFSTLPVGKARYGGKGQPCRSQGMPEAGQQHSRGMCQGVAGGQPIATG